MYLGVVVQDDPRIEEALRVEQTLDAPHQFGRLTAPLHFDEGGHVAPRTVLGLERSVIASDYDLCDLVHQLGIPADRVGVGEPLSKYEMKISIERVAEDDGFGVAVLAESGLQIGGGGGEVLDRHRDVLDDHRGADRTYSADGWKQPLANFPVFFDQIRIG